ncbi:SpoIIIAH-like family protein [Xylanivirga thermophila]|uniref:SpoIIIAH-like family protein n=1 Tax=Xylanivirga thermophila TaxID=2496273 RepID=UPI00101C6B93|nr:SpoIIIAH-like family protein [Xylanivirga thermophila]
MLVVKKKNMVLGILVVLLIITGYLNYSYNQNKFPDSSEKIVQNNAKTDKDKNNGQDNKKDSGITVKDDEEAANVSSSFFKTYRQDREDTRSEEIKYIKSIIDNPESDAEMKKEAQAQLLDITNNMEKELTIESIIKSKGFQDAIAIIHKGSVNVVVDKEELSSEEVAQILDVVKRESKSETENIKIIPKS